MRTIYMKTKFEKTEDDAALENGDGAGESWCTLITSTNNLCPFLQCSGSPLTKYIGPGFSILIMVFPVLYTDIGWLSLQ